MVSMMKLLKFVAWLSELVPKLTHKFKMNFLAAKLPQNRENTPLYLLHMKNVQRFAQAPRGLYRSQDLFADLQVRAVYTPLFWSDDNST
jgi:hypothetical protein